MMNTDLQRIIVTVNRNFGIVIDNKTAETMTTFGDFADAVVKQCRVSEDQQQYLQYCRAVLQELQTQTELPLDFDTDFQKAFPKQKQRIKLLQHYVPSGWDITPQNYRLFMVLIGISAIGTFGVLLMSKVLGGIYTFALWSLLTLTLCLLGFVLQDITKRYKKIDDVIRLIVFHQFLRERNFIFSLGELEYRLKELFHKDIC